MNLKELARMGRSSGKTRTIEKLVLQEVKRMEEADPEYVDDKPRKRIILPGDRCVLHSSSESVILMLNGVENLRTY